LRSAWSNWAPAIFRRQAGLLEESARSFERTATLDSTNHSLNLAGTASQL
jgi:hypothetical protein